MALNVQSFRSNMRGGGARPSLFRLRITAPSWVNFPIEDFTYKANAASLPSFDVGVRMISYMGQDIKFPGDRIYPAYTINIHNDEDFLVRNALERWNNGMSEFSRNTAVRVGGASANPISYVGDLYVDQLGKDGNTIKTYKLVNAWPGNISDVQLDWRAKDTTEEFRVNFNYDYIDTNADSNTLMSQISGVAGAINNVLGNIGSATNILNNF